MTPQVGGSLRFAGSTTFGMKAYGIKPPSALLGAIGTRDEMDLTFRLRAQSGPFSADPR